MDGGIIHLPDCVMALFRCSLVRVVLLIKKLRLLTVRKSDQRDGKTAETLLTQTNHSLGSVIEHCLCMLSFWFGTGASSTHVITANEDIESFAEDEVDSCEDFECNIDLDGCCEAMVLDGGSTNEWDDVAAESSERCSTQDPISNFDAIIHAHRLIDEADDSTDASSSESDDEFIYYSDGTESGNEMELKLIRDESSSDIDESFTDFDDLTDCITVLIKHPRGNLTVECSQSSKIKHLNGPIVDRWGLPSSSWWLSSNGRKLNQDHDISELCEQGCAIVCVKLRLPGGGKGNGKSRPTKPFSAEVIGQSEDDSEEEDAEQDIDLLESWRMAIQKKLAETQKEHAAQECAELENDQEENVRAKQLQAESDLQAAKRQRETAEQRLQELRQEVEEERRKLAQTALCREKEEKLLHSLHREKESTAPLRLPVFVDLSEDVGTAERNSLQREEESTMQEQIDSEVEQIESEVEQMGTAERDNSDVEHSIDSVPDLQKLPDPSLKTVSLPPLQSVDLSLIPVVPKLDPVNEIIERVLILLSEMKWFLVTERFSEFVSQRDRMINLCNEVRVLEDVASWKKLRDAIARDNASNHVVSVWIMAENDPYLPEVPFKDWPGKTDLLQETCEKVVCLKVEREFKRLGLTRTEWRQILTEMCQRTQDVFGDERDFIVGETDLAKCRSCGWLSTKSIRANADAVLIKVIIDDNNNSLKLQVITDESWAKDVVDAIIHRIWNDAAIHPKLLAEMQAAFFCHEDGLHFTVISEWREQNPQQQRSLDLGEESCKFSQIEAQTRAIKGHYPEGFQTVLLDVLTQYFTNNLIKIKAHIGRYRRLMKKVPRFRHSSTFPLPLTLDDINKIRNGQAFDYRRADGKWVKAEMVDNEKLNEMGTPTIELTLRHQGKIKPNGIMDEEETTLLKVSRYRLHNWARIRELGSIISRPIHRVEMGFILECRVSKSRLVALAKVPEWFAYTRQGRRFKARLWQNDWMPVKMLEHDADSAQVLLGFEEHLYHSDDAYPAPSFWVHLDDVIEICPMSEQPRPTQKKTSQRERFADVHDCDECDDLSGSLQQNAISTSGLLVLKEKKHSPWIDIAMSGEINPLPKLLRGIKRDVDYNVGSSRAKREMFLRFTSQGLVELRLPRVLLKGRSGFGRDPFICLRLLVAPISVRERKLNLKTHSEAKSKFATQLHHNMHGRDITWMARASALQLDGVILFGQQDDTDLWRARIARDEVYKFQIRPKNVRHIFISCCLGTRKCVSRSCTQFGKIRSVPQRRSRRGEKWNECKACHSILKLSNCENFVFDFRDFGNVLQDSRFPRIVIAAGAHHEDCSGDVDFHSPTAAAKAFLRRSMSWSDWNMMPSVLRKKLFSHVEDRGCPTKQTFTIGQVCGWYSKDHMTLAMRNARRQHLSDLGLTRCDISIFDGPRGIPEQMREVVQYVDTSTDIKIIALWHPKLLQKIAREIQRKRCCFFEDPDFIASQIEMQPELVDLVMPIIGCKDATFSVVKGEELKLIDSLIWNNESCGFVYFSFCITNNESRGAYFVSFLLELLEIKSCIGNLRKIAQSLRYVFDLCTKCRVGFNVAWATLHLYSDRVQEARRNKQLCLLWFQLQDEHDELQAWTQSWFQKTRIPFSIQPDKVHVDRLFIDLKRFVSSERKQAFKQAARELTQALDLKTGMQKLSRFVSEWQDEPALKSRCQLLLSPYYIRHVFHWAKNVRSSDVLQYLTYNTSNPIESLHAMLKIASRGGKLSVLSLVEMLQGLLLAQAQSNFEGKAHRYGLHRNLMRVSAVKGAKRFKARKTVRSSFAAGRLDRCRKQNIGNVKCRYKLNINELAGVHKGTKVFVWGWKNSIYSAESELNVSTLGLMYPGLNSHHKKSPLDQGLAFIGKLATVIKHWNDPSKAQVLLSLIQWFADKATHSTTRMDKISKATWKRHWYCFSQLKARALVEQQMLELFDFANLSEFATMELDDLLQGEEWREFTQENKVHWLGDAVNNCWDKVLRFEAVQSLSEMASRVRNKDFSHTYILHLLQNKIDKWFALKLIFLEQKLVFCWYTQFSNNELMSGKKRGKEENTGIWRILHAVERDLSLALFWHAGYQAEDIELWRWFGEVVQIWNAFDTSSEAFSSLRQRCNPEDLAESEDESAADRDQSLINMSSFIRQRFDHVQTGLKESLYPVPSTRALRRLLAMFKEHKRNNVDLFISANAMLITLRHRRTEIAEIVHHEQSRILGDVVRRGVIALNLGNASTNNSTESQRRRSEHQLHPDLAIAEDQLRDDECVDVMQSSTCFGRHARPIVMSTQDAQAQSEAATATSNTSILPILQLVNRTLDEMERGVTESPFVCVECVPLEEDKRAFVQCGKCPMKLHLDCASIEFAEVYNSQRDGSVWICFACLGMLQLNFTSSVPRRHETVSFPRKHQTTRRQLLIKVNRSLSCRWVCALELQEPIAFALHLALWIEPIRRVFKDEYLFQEESSDAFLLGTIFSLMEDHSFLPRNKLGLLLSRLPSNMMLIGAIKMILDAFAAICDDESSELNCSFVSYEELDTSKHVPANITVVSGAPKFATDSDDAAVTNANCRDLSKIEGVGELKMILTRQHSCLLIGGDANAEVIEVGQDMVMRKRESCYWQQFQDQCGLFYFQEQVVNNASSLEGERVNHNFGVVQSGQQRCFSRKKSWQLLADQRLDQTKFIRSALCHGQLDASFVGQFSVPDARINRDLLIKERCQVRVEQLNGCIMPSDGDGNCLLRSWAQFKGKDFENTIEGTPEHDHALDELHALRQIICNYYEDLVSSNVILAPNPDECNSCRFDGTHLSSDFVRGLHLNEQVNAYIVEYNETFDDLDVDRFFNPLWDKRYAPLCLLRSRRGPAFHYDWLKFDDADAAMQRLTTEERRVGDAQMAHSVGFESFRGYASPPLRQKFYKLNQVDETVWRFIVTGKLHDNSSVGDICRARNRVLDSGFDVIGLVCGASEVGIIQELDQEDGAEHAGQSTSSETVPLGVYPINKKLRMKCTDAEVKVVCGFARQNMLTMNRESNVQWVMASAIVDLILDRYRRRISKWERKASSILVGSVGVPRRLRMRPSRGDEILLRQHYRAAMQAKTPVMGGCVMRFYKRRVWSLQGVLMKAVGDEPSCNRLTGSVRCQMCPIRVHPNCSLVPDSPVCPWCVEKIEGIFARWEGPNRVRAGGWPKNETLRDLLPLDLPRLPSKTNEQLLSDQKIHGTTNELVQPHVIKPATSSASTNEDQESNEEDDVQRRWDSIPEQYRRDKNWKPELKAQARMWSDVYDSTRMSSDAKTLACLAPTYATHVAHLSDVHESKSTSCKRMSSDAKMDSTRPCKRARTDACESHMEQTTETNQCGSPSSCITTNFRRKEQLMIEKRVTAFTTNVNARVTSLWKEWLSPQKQPSELQFTFEFDAMEEYLAKFDEYNTTKKQSLSNREKRAAVMAQTLLLDMLSAIDRIAKRIGQHMRVELRGHFIKLVKCLLLETSILTRFRTLRANRLLFPRRAFHGVESSRLRQKLMSYFDSNHLRCQRSDVIGDKLGDYALWVEEIRMQTRRVYDDFCKFYDVIMDDDDDDDDTGCDDTDESANEDIDLERFAQTEPHVVRKSDESVNEDIDLDRFALTETHVVRQTDTPHSKGDDVYRPLRAQTIDHTDRGGDAVGDDITDSGRGNSPCTSHVTSVASSTFAPAHSNGTDVSELATSQSLTAPGTRCDRRDAAPTRQSPSHCLSLSNESRGGSASGRHVLRQKKSAARGSRMPDNSHRDRGQSVDSSNFTTSTCSNDDADGGDAGRREVVPQENLNASVSRCNRQRTALRVVSPTCSLSQQSNDDAEEGGDASRQQLVKLQPMQREWMEPLNEFVSRCSLQSTTPSAVSPTQSLSQQSSDGGYASRRRVARQENVARESAASQPLNTSVLRYSPRSTVPSAVSSTRSSSQQQSNDDDGASRRHVARESAASRPLNAFVSRYSSQSTTPSAVSPTRSLSQQQSNDDDRGGGGGGGANRRYVVTQRSAENGRRNETPSVDRSFIGRFSTQSISRGRGVRRRQEIRHEGGVRGRKRSLSQMLDDRVSEQEQCGAQGNSNVMKESMLDMSQMMHVGGGALDEKKRKKTETYGAQL